MGANKIPYIVTHDARTIRYPAPDINVLDTIKLNLTTGKIDAVYRFESGKIFR
jgi:small subunit ribosomal protein S4e